MCSKPPIAGCRLKRKPHAKQRGAYDSKPSFNGPLRMKRAELFSGLFYVAASRLNSPRLQSIETPALVPVKEAVASSKADGR
jgi:hypothetical protein